MKGRTPVIMARIENSILRSPVSHFMDMIGGQSLPAYALFLAAVAAAAAAHSL